MPSTTLQRLIPFSSSGIQHKPNRNALLLRKARASEQFGMYAKNDPNGFVTDISGSELLLTLTKFAGDPDMQEKNHFKWSGNSQVFILNGCSSMLRKRHIRFPSSGTRIDDSKMEMHTHARTLYKKGRSFISITN